MLGHSQTPLGNRWMPSSLKSRNIATILALLIVNQDTIQQDANFHLIALSLISGIGRPGFYVILATGANLEESLSLLSKNKFHHSSQTTNKLKGLIVYRLGCFHLQVHISFARSYQSSGCHLCMQLKEFTIKKIKIGS